MLESFKVLDTGHLNEARQIIASKFCSHKLEIMKSTGKFRARHHVTVGRLLSLNYLSYGETVLIEPGELQHFYLIQIPIIGNADISNGGSEFMTGVRNAAILNPDRHTKMIWHADCEQLLIYVPKDNLIELAEGYLGRRLTHPIVFQPNIDFENTNLAHLRKSALVLADGADRGIVFGQTRAVNQLLLEESFLTELLCHQPSNITQQMSSMSKMFAPKHAKLARDFIIENVQNSICVNQIASAAGVPIRTLQHQFGHFYNMSPIEMLKRERLYRIYGELDSGHICGPVAAVASKWGFSHFGRFSKNYQMQFGELPSETKSRALKLRSLS
ncbi:MAG: AraC family transcriptional regulator [Rhizobiaceae bacterium]